MRRVFILPMSWSSAPQRTSRRGTDCHTTCFVCFQTSLWRNSPSPKPTIACTSGSQASSTPIASSASRPSWVWRPSSRRSISTRSSLTCSARSSSGLGRSGGACSAARIDRGDVRGPAQRAQRARFGLRRLTRCRRCSAWFASPPARAGRRGEAYLYCNAGGCECQFDGRPRNSPISGYHRAVRAHSDSPRPRLDLAHGRALRHGRLSCGVRRASGCSRSASSAERASRCSCSRTWSTPAAAPTRATSGT